MEERRLCIVLEVFQRRWFFWKTKVAEAHIAEMPSPQPPLGSNYILRKGSVVYAAKIYACDIEEDQIKYFARLVRTDLPSDIPRWLNGIGWKVLKKT